MRSYPCQPQSPILSELTDPIPFPNRILERRRRQRRTHARVDDNDDYDTEPEDLMIDPDTSRLLPPRTASPVRIPRHRRHVMVQGRLALVRSVSVAAPVRSAPLFPTASGGRAPHSFGPDTGVNSSIASELSPELPRFSSRGFERGVGGVIVEDTAAGTRMREGRRGRGRSRNRNKDEVNAGYHSDTILGDEDEDARERSRVYCQQLRGYGIGGAGNIRKYSYLLICYFV